MMEPHNAHAHNVTANHEPEASDTFSRDTADLPDAMETATVALEPGADFELRAMPVRKRIGDTTVKMLAYNGSVPGPILRVTQGSEATITFINDTDVESTVHWHGLRLDHRFDGVPQGIHRGMQPPIPAGGRFTYRVRFPDAGLYWYHPHIREDYAQEHGLYGTIIVVPSDGTYWAPVNREIVLVLDDILIEDGMIAPFSQSQPNRTLMGRYGNVMLLNGTPDFKMSVACGEVVRLYIVNTANARIINLGIPGARLKLVGGDNGHIEREELIESVLLAPSERAIVDVLFERPGLLALEHHTPDRTDTLGTLHVSEQATGHSFAHDFNILRQSDALAAERASIALDYERPPDKTLALLGELSHDANGDHHSGHGSHQPVEPATPIEWEDSMPLMNQMSTPSTIHWKLVDRETGAENHAIDWHFHVGDRVKLRLVNEPHTDHPMQHPIHIHGQRFLVLARNGVPTSNLQWKDTVLCRTGETVDLLVEMTEPGAWMVHCHIAEHIESHMMLTFQVR